VEADIKHDFVRSNVLGHLDPDCKIYRIFPIHRVLEVFSRQKNVLVNPDLWDDPFENYFGKSEILGLGLAKKDVQALQSSWYGQCWTLTSESDAMWRIYSPNKDGVRVSTTVRKLLIDFTAKSHERWGYASHFIGAVKYMNSVDIINYVKSMLDAEFTTGAHNIGTASTLLVKRPEFSHEAEVRLLYCDLEGRCSNPDLAEFDFDISIVEDALLDPRLSGETLQRWIDSLQAAGCQCPLYQSALYQMPDYLIDLR